MSKKKRPTAATVKEGERLNLIYVRLSALVHWDRNPKLHDLEGIKGSIREHGFKDPPKWEDRLGGIVEGNGRFAALSEMEAGGEDAPRGILFDAETLDWCVPILVGVDAKTRVQAEAYGVDHNNLVNAGGDAATTALMWDDSYFDLVADIMPEANIQSIDAEGFEQLKLYFQGFNPDDLIGAFGEAAIEAAGDKKFNTTFTLTGRRIQRAKYIYKTIGKDRLLQEVNKAIDRVYKEARDA